MDQVLISLLYIFYKKKKDTKPLKPVTNNFYMYLCILLYNKHKQNKYRSVVFFLNISNHMVELKGLSERHVWCRLLSTV